jgi:HPt (histidine-containing phosphotransfer) domain-containing protein
MSLNPINPDVIQELRDTLGEEFLPELIATYLDEVPRLLGELELALQAGNSPDFTRAAHSIKSNSASLGALDYSALAKELEMIGKSGDLSAAAEKVAALLQAYPEVQENLQQYL